MADYKEMYLSLFRRVSRAIELLQEAQLQSEEMFMSSNEANISLLHPPGGDE